MQERIWREYQVWLLLKAFSDGRILKNRMLLETLAGEIEVSNKTIHRKLNHLIERNWIGINKTSGIFYIRSIGSVMKTEAKFPKYGYWFDIEDIKNIKGYCMAVAITNLIKKQKFKNRDRSTQRGRQFKAPVYYPVSLESLMKFYGLSKRRASVLRSMAHPDFIDMKESFKSLGKDNSNNCYNVLSNIRSGIEENIASKIVTKKGKLYVQKPNRIMSKLVSGKRKSKMVVKDKNGNMFKGDYKGNIDM